MEWVDVVVCSTKVRFGKFANGGLLCPPGGVRSCLIIISGMLIFAGVKQNLHDSATWCNIAPISLPQMALAKLLVKHGVVDHT